MKQSTIILILLLATNSLKADVLGFSLGVNYWNYDIEGTVKSPLSGNSQAAINFKQNNDLNPYVVFEHPVPFIPNFKLQQNNIESSGLIPVSDPLFFAGETVFVRGDINFSHVDLMLYYEILDNWVNLDLGISAKYFDGYQRYHYADVIDEDSDFDDLIPMLYVKGQFDLPLTGLSASATVEALSFDRNKVTDIELALKYQLKFGLGMDVGYRSLDVDLKNLNNFKGDIKMDGFFLGGYFEF